jgi:tRNA A37 threonylcarbamoyladenosine biosynthesis protein TsaE
MEGEKMNYHIRERFTEQEIPVDILRMIINKSRRYSVIILVNGHSQSGKTTFIKHIADRITQIKKYNRLSPHDEENTWKEWNAYKMTATNAYEFVDIWDKYNNEVMTLAECSETLNYLEWWSTMGKVFNSTTTTQGLKRNICFLDTVMSTDIMKHAKEKIDFRIWTAKRYDETRTCITRNGWVEIDYLKDRWRLRWLPNWVVNYSWSELNISRAYTDWIAKGLKADIVNRNKELVGIWNPNRPISERNMPNYIRNAIDVV